MIFRRHSSILDTDPKNWWNEGHGLMEKLVTAHRKSEHLSIADSIFLKNITFILKINSY